MDTKLVVIQIQSKYMLPRIANKEERREKGAAAESPIV
jgi:hypothetical protein